MSSSEVFETYRALHSTIKYAGGERPVRSVLVVDVDRDTPSDVAEGIAMAFARAGDNCALIDANFRTAPEETAGFSDLIAGSTVEDGGGVTDDDGLTRLGPGTRPDPDLLAGDALSNALGTLGGRFAYLVLMCGPLPEFGDAVAIAPCVDAAILVVSAGVTGREAAIEARDALERVGARMLGIVMVERPRRWY